VKTKLALFVLFFCETDNFKCLKHEVDFFYDKV